MILIIWKWYEQRREIDKLHDDLLQRVDKFSNESATKSEQIVCVIGQKQDGGSVSLLVTGFYKTLLLDSIIESSICLTKASEIWAAFSVKLWVNSSHLINH